MQSQNRGGGDGDGSSSAAAATPGKSGSPGRTLDGERPSATAGPRPPSISLRQGFAEALAKGRGGGNTETTPDAGGGGAAFNLLGLPPSPAPLSGVSGGSAWGATGGGSSRMLSDMMAGQVIVVLFGGRFLA